MRRSAATVAAGTLALVALAGCDADDHPNDPRPPSPVELTAKIDNEKVIVAPRSNGAGTFNVTISNQSGEDAALSFDGPVTRSTPVIGAGNVLQFKVALEQGRYTVSTEAPNVAAALLRIGPERPSAQNDLLLP